MGEGLARLVRLDVSAISTREDLHHLISTAFAFPGYYGRNWDAFDECIRDVSTPVDIRVEGIASLEVTLPREATLLRKCLADFAAEVPDGEVSLHVV